MNLTKESPISETKRQLDWTERTLGDCIALKRGHDLTWRDRRSGKIPVMGSAGPAGFHDTPLARGPGVVLGRSGASFGQAHYCETDFWPHNTALYVTDFRQNEPRFIFYLLKAIDFSRHNSGGAQQSLNRNFIAPIAVRLPQPSEQRKIVRVLDDVDALLRALDRLIAKKRDLKQAAMQQLLTGQTRLPGFAGEWKQMRLGNVAQLNRLNVTPASQPSHMFTHFSLPAFDAGRTPVVELGSAIGSNKFRVPQGAILVSKLNPRIARVWAPDDIQENAIASTEFLVLTSKEGTVRGFLFTLCSSTVFCDQMELAATGTTGSHQRLSPCVALTLKIFFPIDVAEQAAIATVLSDMDAELEALEQRRAKTVALKQGMMRELLTGRTRLV